MNSMVARAYGAPAATSLRCCHGAAADSASRSAENTNARWGLLVFVHEFLLDKRALMAHLPQLIDGGPGMAGGLHAGLGLLATHVLRLRPHLLWVLSDIFLAADAVLLDLALVPDTRAQVSSLSASSDVCSLTMWSFAS